MLLRGKSRTFRKTVLSVSLIVVLMLNLFPSGIIQHLPIVAIHSAQAGTTLPLELSVTANNGQNNLNWYPLDETTTIEGYNVYRSTVVSEAYDKLNQSPLTNTAFIDSSNIINDTTYYYKIEVIGNNGISLGYSNISSAKSDSETTSTAVSGIDTDTLDAIQSSDLSPLAIPASLVAEATGTARIDLIWNTSTGTAEAAGYEIERSTDGSTFSRIATSDVSYFADLSVIPGVTYFYKVRAYNGMGRTSGYSVIASETLNVTRFEESGSSVLKNSNWIVKSNSACSGGYELCAATTESISFIFTGSAVSWISTKGKDRGKAIVSIDDSSTETVDLYASDTLYQQVVYSKIGLSNTDHTIKVQVLGASSDSTTANTVSVDSFDVLGKFSSIRYEDTNASMITKTGDWGSYSSSQYSDGYEIANSSTGTVTFRFTGTTVGWVSTKDRDRGKATITIDDGLTQTINLYSPAPAFNQTVYRKTGLSNTEHTIRIAVAGTKDPLSVGYKVSVDAFDVGDAGENPISYAKYEESDPGIARTGHWPGYKGASFSGGYAIGSAAAESTVTFTFTGTNISWISPKTSACGIANVCIDNEAIEEIDLYAETSTPVYNEVVYSKTGLTYDTHTITIGVSGNKRTVSSGYNVFIDAFTVAEEQIPAATASPAGGVFDTTQTVCLAANKPATIYYTTDGSIPTTSSIRYIGIPLTISRATLLRYMAIDQKGNCSAVCTQKYLFNDDPLPEIYIKSLDSSAECSGNATITALAIGDGPIENMSFAITKYGTNITRNLGTTVGVIDILQDSRIIDTTRLPDAEYAITVTVRTSMRQKSSQLNIKVNNNKARLGEGYWGMFSTGYSKVNMANGNHLFKQEDISLPCLGLGTNVTRIYNSLSNTNGPLGWGWRLAVPELAEYSDGSVCITRGDGAKVIYTRNGDGSYGRPVGYYQTLTKTANNSFTWMFKDQSGYIFDDTSTVEYDSNGNKATYQYDAEGKLATITDPIGRVTTFVYNPENGKLQSVTDYTNRTWNYSYGIDSNLSTVTNPLGYSVGYMYDCRKMVGVSDEESHTVGFGYASDKLSTVFEKPDETTTYTSVFDYSIPDNFSVTNAKGYTTVSKLDSNEIVASVVDPDGNIASFTYDGNFNLLTKTDFRGNTHTYTYDSNGNIESIKDPLGGVTNYTYDDRNNMLSSVNPRGYKTTFTYDNKCNLTRKTDALGGMREYKYDSFGNKLSETNEVTQTTTYSYDVAGNNTLVKDPLNHITKFNYDIRGNKVELVDASGAVTSYEYDSLSRPVKVVDPENNQARFEYDRTGRKVRDIDSIGKITSHTYDWIGRETAETDPLGHTSTYLYDSLDNKLKDIDPTGKITEYSYNKLNQIESVKVTVSDTSTTVTSYMYDANGNKISSKDNKGFITSWEYDPLNRIIKTIKPGNRIEITSYDANGNVVSGAKPDNRKSESDYDALDRLISIHFYKSNGSFDKEISYTYYPDGKRQTKKDNQGITIYTYDEANNLIKEQRPGGIINYMYDATNRLKSRNLDGKGMQFNYDKADCLTSIVDTDTNTSIVTYAYDSNKNRTNMNYRNGINTAYTYDFTNKITKLESKDYHDQLLSNYNYAYYANNLLQTESGPGGAISYKYDGEKKLTEVNGPGSQTIQYAYDSIGNRTRSYQTVDRREYGTLYTYDAPTNELTNVITQDSTTTYSYDANGSLVKKERFRKPITEQKSVLVESCNDASKWVSGMPQYFPISQETSDVKEGAGAVKVTSAVPADFDDDFNRVDGGLGSNWTILGNPTKNATQFQIESNRVLMTGSASGYAVYNGKSNYTDCAISCVPTAASTNGQNEYPGLFIRSDGSNNIYGGNCYAVRLASTYGMHIVELYRIENGYYGSSNRLGYWSGYPFDKTVKLQAIGNNIKVFVDGQQVISVIDNTYSSGYCGITKFSGYYTYLDDVNVNDYSHNRYVTRDLGSGNVQDLSNADTLSFWMKSSAVGDYSFSFGELSSDEQTYNFRSPANTWTKYTWDIYSMPASIRDAVRYFRLRLDSTPTATSTILLDEITTHNHDATTTYEYNEDNQLTKVITKPGLDTTQTITFTYNGDNERIQKTVIAIAGGITATETVNYIYDGLEIAQEKDEQGNIIAEYTYDENSTPVTITKNGQTYYYHFDGLGNVVSLTNSSGRIVSTYSYDAWGNITGRTGTIETPYAYRGKYGYIYDKETALYFLQSRYYDPQVGRFTTKDRFEGFDERPLSQNPYVYCENDPINNVDPDGQWGSEVHNAMTYGMALKAGFSKGDAMWLGQTNEWFDNLNNPAVCPQAHFDINPTDTDSRDTYFNEHFNSAVKFMKEYNKTGDYQLKADAFVELAAALHARQDKYAHLTVFHQDWYDDTKIQPERFSNAQEATKQVLIEFSNLTKPVIKPNPKAKTKIKQLASVVRMTSISKSSKRISSSMVKSIKRAAITMIKRR